jgi:hypothetical protein
MTLGITFGSRHDERTAHMQAPLLCLREQTPSFEIERRNGNGPQRATAMGDSLRRKRLGRTALLGSMLLALAAIVLFGAARYFVA